MSDVISCYPAAVFCFKPKFVTTWECWDITPLPHSLWQLRTLRFKPDTSLHGHVFVNVFKWVTRLVTWQSCFARFKPDTSPDDHAATERPSVAPSYSHASVQARYVTTWPCCDSISIPYTVWWRHFASSQIRHYMAMLWQSIPSHSVLQLRFCSNQIRHHIAILWQNILPLICALRASLRLEPDTSPDGHGATEYPCLALSYSHASVQVRYVTAWPCCDSNYVPSLSSLMASLRFKPDTSLHGHAVTIIMSEYPRLALSYSHASVQARYVTAWPCCDNNYVPSLSSLMASLRFKPDTSLHGYAVTEYPCLTPSYSHAWLRARYVISWPCCRECFRWVTWVAITCQKRFASSQIRDYTLPCCDIMSLSRCLTLTICPCFSYSTPLPGCCTVRVHPCLVVVLWEYIPACLLYWNRMFMLSCFTVTVHSCLVAVLWQYIPAWLLYRESTSLHGCCTVTVHPCLVAVLWQYIPAWLLYCGIISLLGCCTVTVHPCLVAVLWQYTPAWLLYSDSTSLPICCTMTVLPCLVTVLWQYIPA